VRSNTARLLVRNVSHLVMGQAGTTALGILLAAVIGRALEPAELGNYYIVLAVSTFAYVIADWGQSTYLVREMARGRADEPELIGSALVFRTVAIVCSAAIAVGIALAQGYSAEIVALTLLAMTAAIPATLFVPLDCSFRGKDRMDLDAIANIVGKATAVAATFIALRFGGGLTEVILMAGVGTVSMLLVGIIAARRLHIRVKAPVLAVLKELFRRGAPITVFSLVLASQSFFEIALLSAFAGASVVGWYGASKSILGIVTSPAMILLTATFPELSRASLSWPDLRRMIDTTGRVMFIAAAFTTAGLYAFADDMVAIIYGQGRFEQTASILRANAIFVPLMCLVLVSASAMMAIGRNKELAIISVVRVGLCVLLNWLLIGYWQQNFGNGAIAVVVIAGVAEVPATIACLIFLPRGAVGPALGLDLARAYIVSICTVVPLSMMQPAGLLYRIPLFVVLISAAALITRLISQSDLQLAMEVLRGRGLALQAVKPAQDE
jgi:O-antigen/teichoic acid export membrane protein